MGNEIEKLKHLLPHLLEHNLEHVQEHKKWVAMCEEAGLNGIAEDLKQVVTHFEACTPLFEAAVAKIQKA